MVVKGTNHGSKRKIDEVCPTTSSTTSGTVSSPITTPQCSPKNCAPCAASPPISGKLSTIPRAQRKFAQGVVIPSPPVTPYKIPKTVTTPVKKVRIPQYSPPIKRPKTEDFLTFLCYRGTSALPKSLNFFNYPSHYDRVTDFVKVKSRNELKSWRKDSASAPTVPHSSSSTNQRSQGTCGPESKASQALKFKSAQKLSTTTAKGSSSKSLEAITKKAEKDKGSGKIVKKSSSQIESTTTTLPPQSVPLPKPTHINEQDAKFAISALKLKYQEKRLANAKPSLSVATKLAKKVKDRRVIFTRSKSKDDEVVTPPKSGLKKSKTPVTSTQELSRRNAPSPDIIDAVKLKQQSTKASSSSSDSDSTSSDERSSKSSRSKSSEKQVSTTVTRSLRSVRKTVETKTRPSSKVTSKSFVPKRISTRASRRNSTSPLRELPMYGVLKKRKKRLKTDKSPGRKKGSSKKDADNEKSSLSSSSRRPSRKTKESAAFFLNLITNTFSSDENDNGEKSEDQSEGDTSSSETKFLENRYKAIMKRDEEKGGSRRKSAIEKSGNGKKERNKTPAVKKSVAKSAPSKSQSPEKRILRSESSRREYERGRQVASSVSTRVTRRRATVPIDPVEKPFHAGAARKSASVFPRRNKRSSNSSSHSSSSEDSSSSSNSSSDSESEENTTMGSKPEVKSKSKQLNSDHAEKSRKVTGRTKQNSDASESESSDADTSDKEPRQRSFSTGVTEENLRPESLEQKSGSSSGSSTISDSNCDSSCSEGEEVVEKVTIAIQVDMDLEESLEAEAAAAAAAALNDETPPPVLTPHFMSQGCQSEFPPQVSSRSSPSQIPRSHNVLPPQAPPPQHPMGPPLLPFPAPNFYPSLSNFEFISQHRTQQDFSVMLPTLGGLPTVSTYSFGPQTVLTHNQLPGIPIGYSATSISAATTLQTHIRSVAANLDIPLVRPVVSAAQSNLLPLTRPTQLDPHRPLTRPIMNAWQEGHRHVSHNAQQHYSAFRVPVSTTLVTGTPHQQRMNMMPPVSSAFYPNMQAQSQSDQIQRFQSASMGTRAAVPLQRPMSSVPSVHPGLSAHGLSLIQSLPNVSIVPKFDRTVKAVVIAPDQQPAASNSAPEKMEAKKESKAKEKNGPPKEKGRKRKVLPFTNPPSPLLVRKDSTNPITYIGAASKKNLKGKEHEQRDSSAQPTSTVTDQFNQLILQKESVPDEGKVAFPAQSPSLDKNVNGAQNAEESEKCPFPRSPTKDPDKVKPSKRSTTDSDSLKSEKSLKGKRHGTDSPKPKKTKEKTSKTSKVPDEKRSKKRVPESPRSNSVSSERSSRVSESQDEVKVEDILAYYPTEEEFQDPLRYIRQIQAEAQRFGIARIVPPKSFRPECNVEDDMRFTAYNHYIHRMHQRWGPNVHVRVGIMENLRKSKVGVTAANPPMLGGMEVDLTVLYHTVQSFGGLTEVIQKDKWNKVSDAMNIPKAANDRASKLDAIYVKYVLPYEMLSEAERSKLLKEVEKKWRARISKDTESGSESDEDDPLLEADDCIVKGKSTPLSSYYRVARNTMSMLFKSKDPSHSEVESAYWKLVRERDRHLCVYSGSIDCAGLGWGFPLPKNGAKHPWNLKVLASNSGSILRSMGSVMGATVPTLHVGMVFTTYCWYRDPHNLPWVEYLHSGGNKIWYVIPASHESSFRQVLKELMPRQCKDKKIWLTSDSAMVPPELLLSQGIPLFRAVQNPGEFLVVFPKAFTSAICTGYVISESVCFASPEWLQSALKTFQDIRESKEPPVFPLEKLLLSILTDTRVSTDVLQMALPVAEQLLNEELALRKKLRELGVSTGRITKSEDKGKKNTKKKDETEVQECDTCNYVLHLSLVTHKPKKLNYCLPHAIQQLTKYKSRVKVSSMLYDETDAQLRSILDAAQSRLE